MKPDFDIAIVGSGYAGSIMAMVARRLGRRVLLLDKSRHPRFAIGESSTPLANLLLEEIAAEFDLPQLLPLTAWGPWQRTHPRIGCGLKRGFSFYHHTAGTPFSPREDRSNELLVAASPNDEVADTHWYRPDFDQFLAQEAAKLGVEVVEEVELDKPEFTPTGVQLTGQHKGSRCSWSAAFLIDATGPNGFLHRQLGLKQNPFSNLPKTQALFSHFTGVARWADPKVGRASSLPQSAAVGTASRYCQGQAGSCREESIATSAANPLSPGGTNGERAGERGVLETKPPLPNPLLRLRPEERESEWSTNPAAGHGFYRAAGSPPYPPDDAALHHIFDGGWMWVLRFNNGITSAGVSVSPALATELRLADGQPAWQRVLERFPSVGEQFSRAENIVPFVHAPSIGFRSSAVVGERWAMLPSAAGFVDPLLSTGFPLALLGIQRLGRAFRNGPPSARALHCYGKQTLADLAIVEALVSALFARMDDLGAFSALTMLYFAAASFSESARRLHRVELAPGFLLRRHDGFRTGLLEICSLARKGHPAGDLVKHIEQLVEPFNVIGLFQPRRRNWYPVDFADLYRTSAKLNATPADIDAFLAKAGLLQPV